MLSLGITIPTVNRKDLLLECLSALARQRDAFDDLVVVDNGRQSISVPDHYRAEILVQERNLGVAASWNLGLRELFSRGATHALVLNDDIVPGSVQVAEIAALVAARPELWMFVGKYYWSVWVLSREGADSMAYSEGKYFDEAFHPAYFEDNDFHYRMAARFPGRYLGDLAELVPAICRNSMTIERDPRLNSGFEANRERYIRKWGGEPGEETNAPPGGFCLEYLYDQACRKPSDLHEHVPALRGLAAQCGRVTEIGGCGGAATWALMSGRPSTLICHDLRRPETAVLAHDVADRERVTLVFREGDAAFGDLEATDFLFVNTVGTYERMSRVLHEHARKVSRYIAILGSSPFGSREREFRKEPDSRIGVWAAIRDFLNREGEGRWWRVRERRYNSQGLTVLERGWIP